MSKRILSLVLALVMVLGTFGTVFAAAPSDVVGTEYETAVDRLIQLGALDGYPDGTFKPLNTITRAEFAAAVVKTKGLKAAAEAAKGLPTDFTDVPATSWASGYIGVASNQGLVNGVGWGQFDPESPVKYEEAITMVMRALGYEEAAQARGGYPYGYLIVANETGLLDSVKGTQGLPAPRGLVAQLLDNALEIPMMIQVGYGSQTTWVVSGTMNTEPRLILDELGFANVVGRVTSVNQDRNRITVDGKVLTVDEGFDFNFVEGLRIKAYYSGTKLVIFTALEEAMYAPTTGGAKITVDGTKYSVNKDAVLELNGKEVKVADAEDFTADYAKVLLNTDDEIVWAKGYDLNEVLVVAEVDGNVVSDLNKSDENLKGYTILKDGKTISIEDVEEMDVLLYNMSEKFAIVYNDSVVGEIDRVYTGEFRIDGEVYEYSLDARYLDGKEVGELNKDILAAMMAEEKEVEVFFNTKGEVVLVVGNQGVAPTTNYFGLVKYSNVVSVRGRNVLQLNVLNDEGKVVEYDIPAASNGKYLGKVAVPSVDDVVSVKIDEDEKIVGFDIQVSPVSYIDATGFKLSSTYVAGKRLQENTVVFYADGTKAVKIADAENIKVVKEADIYFNTADRVVVIVAKDAELVKEEDATVVGLVTNVRRRATGFYEITLEGKVYITESKTDVVGNYVGLEDKIVELTFGKTSEAVTNAEVINSNATVIVESRKSRIIEAKNGKTYELVADAKLYDMTGSSPKAITSTDLKSDDKIEVYYATTGSTRFVNFVVRVAKDAVQTPGVTKGLVTHIDETLKVIYVDSVPYVYGAGSMVKSPKGSIIAVGTNGFEVAGTYELAINDEVSNIEVTSGVITSLVANKIATVQTAAVTAVINTLNSDELNPAHADFNTNGNDVTNARSAYNALTSPAPAQKDYVTNYAKLVAAEAAIAAANQAANAADVATAKADLVAATILNANSALNNVIGNLTLGTTGSASTTIAWASSNTTAVATNGTVTRPDYVDGDATVTLTATITKGAAEDTKVFTVVVKSETALVDVNSAAADTDMRTALGNIITKGDFDAASTASWNGLVPAQRLLVANDVLTARPGGGYTSLTTLQAAFNTALGL